MKKLSMKECSIVSGAGQIVIDEIHVSDQGISQGCAAAIQNIMPKVLKMEVPIEVAQQQLAKAGCVKKDFERFVANYDQAMNWKKC